MRRTHFAATPDFSLLWAALTVSELGTQIGTLATTIVAIELLDASSTEVGFLNAGRTLPVLILALPVGVLMDRISRQPVLSRADLCRCVLTMTVPVAAFLGVLTYAQVVVVVVLTTAGGVFFDLAQHSLLPGVVAREDLASANVRIITSRAAASLAGRGIAALLIGVVGAAATITVDAATFAFSALTCRRIDKDPVPEHGDGSPRLRASLAEGIRFVVTHPLLRPIATGSALANVSAAMCEVALPLLMLRSLGYPPSAVGLVLMVSAAGFTVGAFLGARATRRWGPGRSLVAAAGIPAVAYVLLATADPALSLPQLTTAALILGVSAPAFNATQVTLRQDATPARLLGRMTASIRTITWSAAGVGSVLGGLSISLIGYRLTFAVAAGVALTAALSLALSPVRRVPPARR